VNSTSFYSSFRLIAQTITAGGDSTWRNRFNLSEFKLFGTRERGQSTLHDGKLKLTKNLTVPRIGPPLDADDTPRRDRLVVEYNTSTTPTENGMVRDTSGRGLDGLMYNGAYYDATEKALVFDGSNDYVYSGNIGNPAGDYIHSVSWWFKNDDTTSAISTNEQAMWFIGPQWSAGQCSYASFYNDRLYFAWNTYNINCATTDIKQSQWNHVCFTYTGGGSSLTTRKIYINGVLQTSLLDSTEGQLLNLPGSTYLTLGNMAGQTKYFDGSISQFKLYDVALTADEVKRLYDMGRLGNVIAQPVHIAAPLYAPGVPVQFVSAQVHDKVAYSSTSVPFHHVSPLDISIKPRFSNSKIYLMWRIEYESLNNLVFRIRRNSTEIGYNIESGDVQWSGVSTASYDNNFDSTPQQAMITWIDSPNTTSTVTYKVYAHKSGGTGRAFYLNRTEDSSGKGEFETGVSQKTAMEIAQ